MNNEDFRLDVIEILLEIRDDIKRIADNRGTSRTSPPPQNDSWRDEPASEKQLSLMSKQRIPFTEPITKGKASDLIDGYFRSKNRG